MFGEHDFYHDGSSCNLAIHLWRVHLCCFFILSFCCEAAVQLRSSTPIQLRKRRQYDMQHLFTSSQSPTLNLETVFRKLSEMCLHILAQLFVITT